MDLKTKIGIRVKQLRSERDLTQEQLADKIDRSNDAVSGFERGQTGQALDLIEDICKVTGYSVSELFKNIDDAQLSKNKEADLFALRNMLLDQSDDEVKRILEIARIVLAK